MVTRAVKPPASARPADASPPSTSSVVRTSAARTSAKERRQDSQQLMRQWALVRLLADTTEGYSVKQLADQLGATKPTIERDLATLTRDFTLLDVPVGKQKKLYRLTDKVRGLDAVNFSVGELLSIYAAHAATAGLDDTELGTDLAKAMNKIRGFLSAEHTQSIHTLAQVFSSHARGHVDYGPKNEEVDGLMDAIARRKRCTLTYQVPGKAPRVHEARPLRLVWHQSMLYVLACLGDHQRITTLAVHRVSSVEVSRTSFPVPKLDVDAHISRAFGIFVSDQEEDVEIVFDAEIAWRLEERTFHPSEHKERRADGALVYRIRSSAQWEIIPWVQGFGGHAELRSPPSWRAAIAASAEAMAARYRAP